MLRIRTSGRVRIVAGGLVASAVLLASGIGAFACTSQGLIQLTPTAGVAGSTVTAKGQGFSTGAGASPVALHWNSLTGGVVWTGSPDAEGVIVATFVAPDTSVGSYVVIAQQTVDGSPARGTPVRAPFTVESTTPVVAPTPAPAPAVERQPAPAPAPAALPIITTMSPAPPRPAMAAAAAPIAAPADRNPPVFPPSVVAPKPIAEAPVPVAPVVEPIPISEAAATVPAAERVTPTVTPDPSAVAGPVRAGGGPAGWVVPFVIAAMAATGVALVGVLVTGPRQRSPRPADRRLSRH